MITRFNIEEDY